MITEHFMVGYCDSQLVNYDLDFFFFIIIFLFKGIVFKTNDNKVGE